MTTVTVIISARSAAPWLRQCLESVAGQRLPRGWRGRILLGVDACPETLMEASRLRIPGMVLRYFPERAGPYVIFNSLAYALAGRSEALVRFDADDVMLDDYLRSQLEIVDTRLPMITQTWSIYADPALRPLAARLSDGSATRPDGRRFGASDGQFLMTKGAWNRLGSFQAWWCHADSEFMRRAAWSSIERKVVPRHLYIRRVHSNSVTQSSEMGYRSAIRDHYARQIADDGRLYASGMPPPQVRPATACCFSKGFIVDGRHVYGETGG